MAGEIEPWLGDEAILLKGLGGADLARVDDQASGAPETALAGASATQGTTLAATPAAVSSQFSPALFAPPVIGTGVSEAEDLELTNYVVETRADASGGEAVRLEPAPAADIGTVAGTFAGNADTYHVIINYIDEDDGVSTWTLLINGVAIGDFQGVGGTGAGLARSSLFGVALDPGDVIAVQGERDGGELARIDSIEIQDVPIETKEIRSGITEFEDLNLIGYQIEDRAGVSGGQSVFTLATGTAFGTFTGTSGRYELDIDHLIESDGVAQWVVKINDVEVASFDGAGATQALQLAEFIIDIDLVTGDTILVEGTRVDGATARLDALKLTPLSAGINRAPIAVNDAGQMVDTEVLAFDVISNDSDPDGDPISVTGLVTDFGIVSLAPGESVTFDDAVATLNADSSITLDPNAGFEGRLTIEYVLSDGEDTDIGALVVDVFPATALPPVAATFDVSEDGGRSVQLTVLGAPIASRDITVDWRDGTADSEATLASGIAGQFDHTFSTGGIFDVTISSVSDVANQESTVRVVAAAPGTPPGDGSILAGTEGINALLGDGGNDILNGEAGDDLLRGEAGVDLLSGGLGADILVGGDGRDEFRYSSTDEGGDRIVDFTPGIDKIRVDAAGFGGDLFPGQRVELVVATGAATFNEDGAFLYNPVSGDLFYDVSGAGFSPPVLLATLEGAPAITARDILVAGGQTLGLTVTGPGDDPRGDGPASAPSLGDEGAAPAAVSDQGHASQSLERMSIDDTFDFSVLPAPASGSATASVTPEPLTVTDAAESTLSPLPASPDPALDAFIESLALETPDDGFAM